MTYVDHLLQLLSDAKPRSARVITDHFFDKVDGITIDNVHFIVEESLKSALSNRRVSRDDSGDTITFQITPFGLRYLGFITKGA